MRGCGEAPGESGPHSPLLAREDGGQYQGRLDFDFLRLWFATGSYAQTCAEHHVVAQ